MAKEFPSQSPKTTPPVQPTFFGKKLIYARKRSALNFAAKLSPGYRTMRCQPLAKRQAATPIRRCLPPDSVLAPPSVHDDNLRANRLKQPVQPSVCPFRCSS